MSELREPLVRVERALSEDRLDDSDQEALDKLILARLLKEKAERDHLRDERNRLQVELEQAQRAISDLQSLHEKVCEERDIYLNSLYALLRDQKFTFTEEELADLEKNGVGLDSVLEDLAD
jgi:hypothetical protein